MSEFYKDGYVEELEAEVLAYRRRIEELDHANTVMLRVIHDMDAKQALIEASPEFKQELEKLNGQHELPAVGGRTENAGTSEEIKTSG